VSKIFLVTMKKSICTESQTVFRIKQFAARKIEYFRWNTTIPIVQSLILNQKKLLILH